MSFLEEIKEHLLSEVNCFRLIFQYSMGNVTDGCSMSLKKDI